MLILSRGIGQWLTVDGPCRVYVVEIQPGRVKLGVAAAGDVRVVRGEIEGGPKGTTADPSDVVKK
jgi:carbon storage regulator CsrA